MENTLKKQQKQYIKTICSNFQYLRKTYRMTQFTMAKLLHISTYSLRKLEHGQIPPRLNMKIVYRIYDVFGISPQRFFDEQLEDTYKTQ